MCIYLSFFGLVLNYKAENILHLVSSKLRSENNWKEAGCRLRAGALLTFSTPLRLVRRHSESGRDSFHNFHQYLTTTTFFRDFSLQRRLGPRHYLTPRNQRYLSGEDNFSEICVTPHPAQGHARSHIQR